MLHDLSQKGCLKYLKVSLRSFIKATTQHTISLGQEKNNQLISLTYETNPLNKLISRIRSHYL